MTGWIGNVRVTSACYKYRVEAEDVVRAGPIAVSPYVACAAWLDGVPLVLSAHQTRALASLVAARGRLLTRDELYEASRGRLPTNGSRAIDSDVWRLRRALGSLGPFLRSVRKVGYALDVFGLERLVARDDGVTRSFPERDGSVTGA